MPLIRCTCGVSLPRPLPAECPNCGVLLRSVRKRVWPVIVSLLFIAALFGTLFVVMWRLTQN